MDTTLQRALLSHVRKGAINKLERNKDGHGYKNPTLTLHKREPINDDVADGADFSVDDIEQSISELRSLSTACRSFSLPGLHLNAKLKRVDHDDNIELVEEESCEKAVAQASRAAWHQHRKERQQLLQQEKVIVGPCGKFRSDHKCKESQQQQQQRRQKGGTTDCCSTNRHDKLLKENQQPHQEEGKIGPCGTSRLEQLRRERPLQQQQEGASGAPDDAALLQKAAIGRAKFCTLTPVPHAPMVQFRLTSQSNQDHQSFSSPLPATSALGTNGTSGSTPLSHPPPSLSTLTASLPPLVSSVKQAPLPSLDSPRASQTLVSPKPPLPQPLSTLPQKHRDTGLSGAAEACPSRVFSRTSKSLDRKYAQLQVSVDDDLQSTSRSPPARLSPLPSSMRARLSSPGAPGRRLARSKSCSPIDSVPGSAAAEPEGKADSGMHSDPAVAHQIPSLSPTSNSTMQVADLATTSNHATPNTPCTPAEHALHGCSSMPVSLETRSSSGNLEDHGRVGTDSAPPAVPSAAATAVRKPQATAQVAHTTMPWEGKSNGSLKKIQGSLQHYQASRMDVGRLDADTYMQLLQVESRKAMVEGRYAGGPGACKVRVSYDKCTRRSVDVGCGANASAGPATEAPDAASMGEGLSSINGLFAVLARSDAEVKIIRASSRAASAAANRHKIPGSCFACAPEEWH